MKNTCIAFVAIAVLASIMACSDSGSGSTSSQSNAAPKFRQVGYLKDKVNNRIFSIAIPQTASIDLVRSHAEKLPYTPGQMTGAYYFLEGPGIPADGITLAGNVLKANRVLYDTPGVPSWRFAYQRSFNGQSVFYDCHAAPSADLCKSK